MNDRWKLENKLYFNFEFYTFAEKCLTDRSIAWMEQENLKPLKQTLLLDSERMIFAMTIIANDVILKCVLNLDCQLIIDDN